MKKVLFLISLSCIGFFAKAQVPADTAALRAYINSRIVPNGNKLITGQVLHDGMIGIINLMGSGGNTLTQILTSVGSTSFTFTSVPISYNDYMIFNNGSYLTPTVDYNTSGNVVTLSFTTVGDKVIFRRIK